MAGIVDAFVRGHLSKTLGPNWQEERRLKRAAAEEAEARPGLIDLQKRQAEGAIKGQELAQQKAEMELERAQEEYEEVKRLFAEGKIGSSSVKTAEYLLKKAESEARIASEAAQARAAGALEGERRVQTERTRREMQLMESPEEARERRAKRDKYLEAQTGAVEALGGAREKGREFAGVPVPDAVWQELESAAEEDLTTGGNDWLPFNEQPPSREALEAEVQRRAKMRGYLNRGAAAPTGPVPGPGMTPPAGPVGPTAPAGPKVVRDQQGNQFLELPNGVRLPLSGGAARPSGTSFAPDVDVEF